MSNGVRYVVRPAVRGAGNRTIFRRGRRCISRCVAGWRRAAWGRSVAHVQSLLRELGGRKGLPTTVVIDSRMLQSTPESAASWLRQAKRRKGRRNPFAPLPGSVESQRSDETTYSPQLVSIPFESSGAHGPLNAKRPQTNGTPFTTETGSPLATRVPSAHYR